MTSLLTHGRSSFLKLGSVPQLKHWVILPAHSCPKGKVQVGLEQDWAVQLWPSSGNTPLPAGCICVPTSPGAGSSEVQSCRYLLGGPQSTPKPWTGFTVRSHWWLENTACDRVFSVPACRRGRKKHWFKAPTCVFRTCFSSRKVGWWSSLMNPTSILKQIGQVGLVSTMNKLPKPPWKGKQRALLCKSPASLEGMTAQ